MVILNLINNDFHNQKRSHSLVYDARYFIRLLHEIRKTFSPDSDSLYVVRVIESKSLKGLRWSIRDGSHYFKI